MYMVCPRSSTPGSRPGRRRSGVGFGKGCLSGPSKRRVRDHRAGGGGGRCRQRLSSGPMAQTAWWRNSSFRPPARPLHGSGGQVRRTDIPWRNALVDVGAYPRRVRLGIFPKDRGQTSRDGGMPRGSTLRPAFPLRRQSAASLPVATGSQQFAPWPRPLDAGPCGQARGPPGPATRRTGRPLSGGGGSIRGAQRVSGGSAVLQGGGSEPLLCTPAHQSQVWPDLIAASRVAVPFTKCLGGAPSLVPDAGACRRSSGPAENNLRVCCADRRGVDARRGGAGVGWASAGMAGRRSPGVGSPGTWRRDRRCP